MGKKELIDRRWLVLLGCMLILMSLFGVINNCYQLYIIPVCEDLGFSRTAYSFTQFIYYISVMLTSVFAVSIFRRFGVLRTLRVSTVILMLLYCCNSLVSSLPFFYIIGILEGLFMGLNCIVPTSIILRQWFKDKLGFALGIASMGSGLGGLLFSQIAKLVLLRHDWRMLYMSLGLCMGTVGIFSAFVLLREKCGAAGPQPAKAAVKEQRKPAPKFPIAATIIIFTCIAIHTFGNNSIIYTSTPFVQDEGYSFQFAADLSSVSMGVFALGKAFMGEAIDRVGIKWPSILSFAAISLGNLGLALLGRFGTGMLLLMILGVLVGCPFNSVAVPILSSFTARPEHRDRVTGVYVAAVSLGSGSCPLISSVVYDRIGTYRPVYYLMAAAVFLAALVMFRMIPGKDSAQ